MPQLNTSEVVRQRVSQLISRLIAFANYDLEGCEHLRDKIQVRWLDKESGSPKLVVETEIRFLAELVFAKQDLRTKNHLKQDLKTLERFLGILEDNRTRTQGSSTWHFTLSIWHPSVARNLEKLNEEWERQKHENSSSAPSRAASSTALYPLSKPIIDLPKEISASKDYQLEAIAQPYHNLPAKDYGRFIGRVPLLNRLWHLLSSHQAPARISIQGIGGMGKTSVVLEIAHQLLEHHSHPHTAPDAQIFDAIIFASAQQHRLSTHGIIERHCYEPTLLDIFRVIAQTLEHSERLLGDANKQFIQVQRLLSQQPTLLILDNLDTIEPASQKAVLSFLYDLPSTVKVIVTSREQVSLDTLMNLDPLNVDEGLQLIEHYAQLKSVNLTLAEAQRLFDYTGGVPAAMVYAIGQLSGGYPLATVLPKLTLPTGDYCRYYLENAIASLRGHLSHQLLMTLVLFPQPASREAIAHVALGQTDAAEGFATLHQRSLIVCQQGRYSLLPLMRDYALAELNAHPEFDRAARARWVQWALDFLSQFTHSHWREWTDTTQLNQEWGNLQAVIEWCIEHHGYDDFCQLWPLVKGYTYIHGYWNERLTWLNWWVEAAQARHDQIAIAQALRDKGWTLMLMGHPEQLAEADACFEQAWIYCTGADLDFQLDLKIESAVLSLHQDQVERARHQLIEAKTLLMHSKEDKSLSSDRLGSARSQSELTDLTERTKNAIRIDYYMAEVDYRQGHFDRAKDLYRVVLEKAQAAQWEQVEVYTLNWLADIALHQNELDEAEALLERSFPGAQRYRDMRSQALHQKTRARLEQLRGNLTQFRDHATAAISTFENLGMQAEGQEIQAWLMEAAE